MAYSSVRVQFEIGHEASVRTKKTPEGFTHDWEVFVRGADNTDIQCFVEKVVFHLHETFPKPRRVIKEPPYLVKESGYAGFVLPIDVYLKNKEEPKKISFQYDLQLQPSGPPISRVLREPRLFQNPSEDFRRKLIRGGGVGVDAPSDAQHSDDLKSLPGAIKIKSTDSTIKKHKADTVNTNDSFAELFGTPIRRVLDLKKASEPGKKPTEKEPDSSKNKKKLNKYDAYKEDKEKNTEKERTKERERMKEKQGRRPPSPPSGSASGVQCVKSKEEHKKHDEKKKEEYDEKKRKKEERDRDKREKMKDIKETGKQLQEKDHKKDRKDFKNLEQDKKTHLLKSCEVKGNYEKHDAEFSEKEKHKHRHKKKEKDKNKDREKQKKREERDEREKEKGFRKRHEENRDRDEKGKRKSKSKSSSPVPDRLKKKPLNALLDELGSSDSMSPMSDEDANHPFRCGGVSKVGAAATKAARSFAPIPSLNTKSSGTNLNALESNPKTSNKEIEKMGKIMGENDKKDRSSSKKSKKSKEDGQKRKGQQTEERRPRSPSSEAEDDDVERPRLGGKDERERTDKERLEEEKSKANKEKDNKKRKRDKSADKGQAKTKKSGNAEDREGSPAAQGPGLPGLDFAYGAEDVKRSSSSDRFTKEYVAQLKDLQHRIMSLEDNAELQKVVKVIAETGQYEITKKTFDFDLCALDFDTVKRLQDFFLPT